ncbi:hypothetical protein HZA86_03605 [Candidatus Uhrbacteria bacterium]|nr:hypothetical protein [Candidatus Uhrbacteria bacterium]
MKIEDVLKQYGLDADETAVYLAALQLGGSPVQEISNQSGVKRTSVYLVAKSLMNKGILGEYKTRRGLHLVAQPPELLVSQLEEKAKAMASIIPRLKAIAKKEPHKPQVQYFEGKQGYFSVCEDTLQKHASELLWLGDPAEIYAVIGEKYDNDYYIPTRVKRKICLRGLLIKNAWSEKLVANNRPDLLRDIKFLPDDFPFCSTQFIYHNKVAFISSTNELISVLVHSQDLAAMERAKFELLWSKYALLR